MGQNSLSGKRHIRTRRQSDTAQGRKQHRERQLLLERLEDRRVLATWATDIDADMTWSNDEVQLVTEDIAVASGVTLTIEPGTIVQFERSNGLTIEGSLNAIGTATERIVFTADRDDTGLDGILGTADDVDTTGNGPSNGTVAWWESIVFAPGSSGNVMEYVEVRYGGANAYQLIVDQSELALTNAVLRDGLRGIQIINSDPLLTNVVIQDHNKEAARTDLASNPTIRGATIIGNELNAMLIEDGRLPGDTTWNNPDIVYVPMSDITVPEGTTFTIEPGQIVKWGGVGDVQGRKVTVAGRLLLQGTASQPITFTSYKDDSVGGNLDRVASTGSISWEGIEFTSTSQGNVIDHADIRYGGATGGSEHQIFVDHSDLTISNSVLGNGRGGVLILDSDPTLTNVAFDGHLRDAVQMDLLSDPVFVDVTMTGNNTNGVEILPGTLTRDTTWNDPSVLYLVRGDVIVPTGITLTVVPGQIVKWGRGNDDEALIVAGTLLARGTPDQHIIFTSHRDDTAGGDTDGIFSGRPVAGDWDQVLFQPSSTGSELEYFEVRYAGDGDIPASIAVDDSEVNIRNSIIRDSRVNGIATRGDALLTLQNSFVFRNGRSGLLSLAGSTINATNNTIDDNREGVHADAATINLVNSLVTNHEVVGFLVEAGGIINASFNDIYNVGSGSKNFGGTEDVTGTDGNVSVDPLYFSAEARQYALRGGSPVIDAGTSDGAPPSDHFGHARFDDPNVVNRGGGSMPFFDMGAIERQETSTSDVDLAVTAVNGPTSAMQDDIVAITWEGINDGIASAFGPWHDAIYLSADPVWTPDDVFLKEVAQVDDVAPGQTWNGSTTVTLPGVFPGGYYFLVRANWMSEVFEATALRNNTGASTEAVAMDLPELTLGVGLSDTITASGESKLYKVDVPGGESLNVGVTGPDGVTNELYLKFADAPTASSFDARGVRPNSADQVAAINSTQPGTYYALVHGARVPSTEAFNITAKLAEFEIASIEPVQGSNTGNVTINIFGSQLDLGSIVRLTDSAGVSFDAADVFFTDTGLLSATFGLTGAATGLADIQVIQPGGASTQLADGFEIVTGTPGRLIASISTPARMRLGRTYEVTIEYSNVGDTDLLAPIMRIQGDSSTGLRLRPTDSESQDHVSVLAVNPHGPAGILPPGASGSLTLYADTTESGTARIDLFNGGYPDVTFDWDTIGPTIRPFGLADTTWAALLGQLEADYSNTWQAYQSAVSDAASLLPPSMGLNYSLRDVFQLLLDQSRANLYTSVAGTLVDATGASLPDVEITLFDQAAEEFFRTVTLLDGSFLFPRVSPGSYAVELAGYLRESSEPIVVGTEDLNDVSLIALMGGQIAGSVVTNEGVPVRDTTVSDNGRRGHSVYNQHRYERFVCDSWVTRRNLLGHRRRRLGPRRRAIVHIEYD